jgi:hypothetical protein
MQRRVATDGLRMEVGWGQWLNGIECGLGWLKRRPLGEGGYRCCVRGGEGTGGFLTRSGTRPRDRLDEPKAAIVARGGTKVFVLEA